MAELDAAGIDDPDEDQSLDAEESVLADAAAHREAGAVAYEALGGDDGARDAIGAALAAVDGRRPFDDIATRLHEVLAELDDVVATTRDLSDSIDEVTRAPRCRA